MSRGSIAPECFLNMIFTYPLSHAQWCPKTPLRSRDQNAVTQVFEINRFGSIIGPLEECNRSLYPY